MANPHAGEVALIVDGERRVARLTLGALAELEEALGTESLSNLIARFEDGRLKARDMMLLMAAGLRGGGWQGDLRELLGAEIEGGPVEAMRAAARLLALAFQVPR